MKTKPIVVLALVLILIGCGKKPEPLYEGLPMQVWVERLKSPDALVRLDALNVLCNLGRTALSIEDEIRSLARDDPNTQVKIRAIETLESMGAVTVEFNDIIQAYNAPLIPTDDEDYSNEEFDAAVDSAMDSADLLEHAKSDDDLSYLAQIENSEADTTPLADKFSSEVPTDPDEYTNWVRKHQSSVVSNILNMLNNPDVLKELLQSGGALEREYAAQKLAELNINDPEITSALKLLTSSSDTSLSRTAKEALKILK